MSRKRVIREKCTSQNCLVSNGITPISCFLSPQTPQAIDQNVQQTAILSSCWCHKPPTVRRGNFSKLIDCLPPLPLTGEG